MSTTDRPSTVADVRRQLERAIGAVAPDVVDEVATIDAQVDLFEEFGLDSMDRLTIMESLAAASGVPIAEDDYPRLTTVASIARHITATP